MGWIGISVTTLKQFNMAFGKEKNLGLGHGRNFKKIIGHREEYSAFLTTSSKAFDCLEHDFVIGNALDFFVEF